MATKYRHARRVWLNPDKQMSGFMICAIEAGRYPFGHVKIADCGKLINLDFDCDTKQTRKAAVKKAQLMIDELTMFRDSILDIEED